MAVASSNTRILVSLRIALPRHRSCFWPTEKRLLLSETLVSSLSTILSMYSKRLTSLSTFQIWSSELSLNGSTFSLIVPYSKNGVCGMNAIFLLRACKPTVVISMSSILICPSSSSQRRNNVCRMEDLPAPVLPTIPTFIFG